MRGLPAKSGNCRILVPAGLLGHQAGFAQPLRAIAGRSAGNQETVFGKLYFTICNVFLAIRVALQCCSAMV
jgi:hypothetical protein